MPIKTYLSNASIAGIRAPNVDTGRAQAYESFAGVFQKMATTADDFARKHLGQENERAALEAVERGDFTPIDSKGRAVLEVYNKIGIAAEAARVETKMRTGLKSLQVEHARDPKGFEEAAGSLRGELLDGLDVRLRVPGQEKFDALTGAGLSNIRETLFKEQVEQDAADLSMAATADIEDAKKLAYQGNLDAAAGLIARARDKRSDLVASGRSPEVLKKLSRDDEEQVFVWHTRGQFDQALRAGNGKAFKRKLEKTLPDEITMVERQKLLTYMDQQLRKRDTAAKEWLGKVKDSVKAATFSLDKGYIPPDLERVQAMAAGTKYEADLVESLSRLRTSQEFARLSPEDREQAVEQLRADKVKDEGEVRALERLERVHTDLLQLEEDDPLQYGVDIGLAEAPEPLDLTDPEKLQAGLEERKLLALQVEEHTGRPASPLSKGDRALVERVLTSLPPPEQAAAMGQLTQVLGKDLAREAFKAMDGKTGGQLGLAGLMAAEGGADASVRLLGGIEQRKANPKLVPTDADMMPYLGPVFDAYRSQPEKAAQVIEGVRNLYAQMAAEEGAIDGTLDSGILDRAIQQATGGLVEQDDPDGWLGAYYVRPPVYGWDEDRFDSWRNTIDAGDIEAMGGVTVMSSADVAEAIRDGDARLIEVDRGRYLVKIGPHELVRGDGQGYFVLDYGKQQ
ncbi:MAG: hypothetical protein K0U84_13395 [Actinomycetia bacterium]|nr:hypothetical protein [Actinomycetes bacterium]